MQTKKLLSVFIIFSLVLPTPLLSQAAGTNILDVVQAHKPGEFFHFTGFGFALTNAGITSLTGIERIKGIDRVTAMNLSGNNVGVIKSNTFNYPVLKNIKILNLSANNLTMIDSDGLHGLENLEVLLLENNNLTSLANGALNGLNKLKHIYIANNPEMGTLKKQIQKQLPKVKIYTMAANKQRFIKAIALVTGIVVTLVLFAITYPGMKREHEAMERRVQEQEGAGLSRETLFIMGLRPELRKEMFFNPSPNKSAEEIEKMRKDILRGFIALGRPLEIFDYLDYAIENSFTDIANLIIDTIKNASPPEQPVLEAFLARAVGLNKPLLADFLVRKGANPRRPYNQATGETPLGLATSLNRGDMVRLFETPQLGGNPWN